MYDTDNTGLSASGNIHSFAVLGRGRRQTRCSQAGSLPSSPADRRRAHPSTRSCPDWPIPRGRRGRQSAG
eukprot:744659-Prymnesium_polylepis.2